ncbi:MAG: bifunctional YncE family protein/alkaline phosphatase family protein [Candidatus Tumulicola sp.]
MALAAALLGAAPRPASLIVYSAPAGDRPAGADAVRPTTAILPNGRTAAPAGRSVFVGTNPLGMTLSPNGNFAVVSNDDERTGGLVIPRTELPPAIGYSLAVVNTQTMTLASVYRDPSATFFMGVAAVRDPRDPARTIVLASDGAHGVVRVFDLDDGGRLAPEPGAIPLPPSVRGGRAFPAGIGVTPNGRVAYVADNLGNAVAVIDLTSRAVVGSLQVGTAPLNVAAAGGHVLISAGGLTAYGALASPAQLPQFAVPAFDPDRSSSVAVLDSGSGGNASGDPVTIRMDPPPDGSQIIGGAAPAAIAMRRDGGLAYVALANVDRVAVVALTGAPRVVRGLDLRLFPDAPYGAQPTAEVLSKDGKRLYVALAGLNAVAVLDARSPTRYRYGLIPTAWYPTALALSPNGRYLYVVNAKGVDGWGLLSRVDLKHTSLVKTTMNTLRYNRKASVAKDDAVIPPLRSGKRSTAIDRIVYVAVGAQTYDAMLGDLKDSSGAALGNGDARFARYPESVTPNLHALVRTYAVADNFYAPDADIDVARQFATAADATLYAQLTARVKSGRGTLASRGEDPEDYPRAGYLFNALARAGLSFRDYGGLLQLSGYGDGLYHLDVPALAGLAGNVDPNYPGDDPRFDDARRAKEFVRDMQRYVDIDQMPSFAYVALPTAHPAGVAEADRALGTIVEFLSHTPHWNSMAVFVVPEGVDGGTDHVNSMRSYCVVVSPLARRGYVGHAHLSVPSVVKTEEEILGLPPLGLNDLLATDMADFFGDAPSPQAYRAIR